MGNHYTRKRAQADIIAASTFFLGNQSQAVIVQASESPYKPHATSRVSFVQYEKKNKKHEAV